MDNIKKYFILIYLITTNTNLSNDNTYRKFNRNFTITEGMESCESIYNTMIKCKDGPKNLFTIHNILFLTFVVASFVYLAYSLIKIFI